MTAQPTFRLKVRTASAKWLGTKAWAVVAVSPLGRQFQLDHLPATREAAEALAAKVVAKASIDPELWTEMHPVVDSAAHRMLREGALEDARRMAA